MKKPIITTWPYYTRPGENKPYYSKEAQASKHKIDPIVSAQRNALDALIKASKPNTDFLQNLISESGDHPIPSLTPEPPRVKPIMGSTIFEISALSPLEQAQIRAIQGKGDLSVLKSLKDNN